jgi:hypothetical protein
MLRLINGIRLFQPTDTGGSCSGAKTAQFVLHHAAKVRLQFSSADREDLDGAERARLDATITKNKDLRLFEER